MAPYLVSNSIYAPEVQYGPYTAVGIVYSWKKQMSKSKFDQTIQYCKIVIMSLFRPFTISFCKWNATDAQTLTQDISQGYVCRFSHEWAKIYYAFIIYIPTKYSSLKIEKAKISEREKINLNKFGQLRCVLSTFFSLRNLKITGYRPMYRPTYGRTDRPSYGDARTHLRITGY